ncbi:hypothetical protein GQ55_3G010400 [Panicum hallii var. hallii]|uniref:RING-type domain-containing protein n=1 Tax=Panicum hallii var. hallii TaxID=1504633 RepID=A0A2T7E4H7_9POAL|nr:hypothetical protein GQ55_3G010400 [Panicum hallii var. hallii]
MSLPSPPPEQELLPIYSTSSDDEDDRIDDLVIATGGLQSYGDGERRRPFAVPPAPAVVFVPWLGIGGGPAPAPAASIDALPTVEVSEPGAVCAICKEELPLAAAARRLPCGHLYDSSCIVPWLEVHNSCPICRSRLPSYNNPPEPRDREVVPLPSSEQDAGSSDQLRAPPAASDEGEEEAVVLSI